MNSNLLSVIIPAHNCSNTIERLLNSIILQHDDDLEIIICDDHSTDNFMDKVKPYYDKLNIKYYKTKDREIHCPSNTRLDALGQANNKWIIFIDSDDMFIPNSFKYIKNAIKECDNSYKVIYSNFKNYNSNTNKFNEVYNSTVWLHGKIYNRHFLIENNINFKENLYILEDMYFNNIVFANIIAKNYKIKHINDFTYIKIDNDKSFTSSIDTSKHKIGEIYFNNYITAILEPFLIYINKYPDSFNDFYYYACQAYIFIYLYMQFFMYSSKDNYIKENLKYIKNALINICNTFNTDIDNIINFAYSNPEIYEKIKNEVQYCEKCKFIEVYSLYEFTNNLFKNENGLK